MLQHRDKEADESDDSSKETDGSDGSEDSSEETDGSDGSEDSSNKTYSSVGSEVWSEEDYHYICHDIHAANAKADARDRTVLGGIIRQMSTLIPLKKGF